jgi:ribosome-associated protein
MTVQQPIPTLDTSENLAKYLAQLLDDKKAEDIRIVDVRKKASFCDFLIIASANVGRQMAAMADHLTRFLKDHDLPSAVEGLEQGEWVLIDGGDVVVHIFRPDIRDYYQLEKMWSA